MQTAEKNQIMVESRPLALGDSTKMLDNTIKSQIAWLRSQGQSIRYIANVLKISRQSVRRYANYDPNEKTIKPLRGFKGYLESNKSQIEEMFFKYEGYCVPMCRDLAKTYDGKVNLRTLQAFCKEFRAQARLKQQPRTERFETAAGDQLQIDFCEKKIMIGGQMVRVLFFVAILGYSRRIFVKPFITENTEAWLDGIESAFRHFGGLPMTIVSDNTKCLVTSHSRGKLELNERYLAFCDYWAVKYLVCTPHTPRSKGKVERAVRYFKDNALPGQSFKSFEDLCAHVENWLTDCADVRELKDIVFGERTPANRFVVERKALLPMNRPSFVSLRRERRKVDHNGLIRVDNHLYRLPEGFANQNALLEITDRQIIVINDKGVVIKLDKTLDRFKPKLQAKASVGGIDIAAKVSIESDTVSPVPNELCRPAEYYDTVFGGDSHG